MCEKASAFTPQSRQYSVWPSMSAVRFTPQEGACSKSNQCPLSAKSGPTLGVATIRANIQFAVWVAYSGLARASSMALRRRSGMTGFARKVAFDGISPGDGLATPEMTTIAAWGKRL